MKIVLKDKDENVVFEGLAYHAKLELDEYEPTNIRTTTGNMVMNDIKEIKAFRLIGAPDLEEDENDGNE